MKRIWSPSQNKEQRKSGDFEGGGICVPIDREQYGRLARVSACRPLRAVLRGAGTGYPVQRKNTALRFLWALLETAMCTKTVHRTTPEDRTKKSRIKARRLAPPRRMTPARSAGRGNGKRGFLTGYRHSFKAFVQLVM